MAKTDKGCAYGERVRMARMKNQLGAAGLLRRMDGAERCQAQIQLGMANRLQPKNDSAQTEMAVQQPAATQFDNFLEILWLSIKSQK
ncbi:MAG: hypothetical protein WCH99_00475 [Verrucomicrobiota bacterium]